MVVSGHNFRMAIRVAAQCEAPKSFKSFPVDRGDDRVVKLHELDGLGHSERFFRIQWERSSGLCIAELARTGTDGSSNHEGGGAFPQHSPKLGQRPLLQMV